MAETDKIKDDLTGLCLRKDLRSFLEELIKHASEHNRTFALVMIDVDRFKRFNDKFGHSFGDEVLIYLSSILRFSFEKETSRLFRFGGDEFIVVLPNKTANEAMQSMSHFKYIMRNRAFVFGRRLVKITTSSGVATFPSDSQTIEGLISRADDAMYFSKRHGQDLTTLTSRIKLLIFLERTFFVFFIGVLFMFLFIMRNFLVKEAIPAAKETFSAFTKSLNLVNYDKIILKDGTVLEGKIKKETYEYLIVNTYSENGTITSYKLEKSEISKIQYGLWTSSRGRYQEYKKYRPNPHEGD